MRTTLAILAATLGLPLLCAAALGAWIGWGTHRAYTAPTVRRAARRARRALARARRQRETPATPSPTVSAATAATIADATQPAQPRIVVSTSTSAELLEAITKAIQRGRAAKYNALVLAVLLSSACASSSGLQLQVMPALAMAPATVTARLAPGGTGMYLPCAGVLWAWADGSASAHVASCAPGEANLLIERHTYREAGDYVLTVRALDGEGRRGEASHVVRVR